MRLLKIFDNIEAQTENRIVSRMGVRTSGGRRGLAVGTPRAPGRAGGSVWPARNAAGRVGGGGNKRGWPERGEGGKREGDPGQAEQSTFRRYAHTWAVAVERRCFGRGSAGAGGSGAGGRGGCRRGRWRSGRAGVEATGKAESGAGEAVAGWGDGEEGVEPRVPGGSRAGAPRAPREPHTPRPLLLFLYRIFFIFFIFISGAFHAPSIAPSRITCALRPG